MANYATLKAAIQQVVKTNGNNEITGALLQQSLLAMVNSLGGYYQFVGIAQPSTNPGTPDQNVFYVAGSGTYPNFNAAVIPDGYIGVFKYNGAWTVENVAVGKDYDEQIGQLEGKVTDLGYDGCIYDIKAEIPVTQGTAVASSINIAQNISIASGKTIKIRIFGTSGIVDKFIIVKNGWNNMFICTWYNDGAEIIMKTPGVTTSLGLNINSENAIGTGTIRVYLSTNYEEYVGAEIDKNSSNINLSELAQKCDAGFAGFEQGAFYVTGDSKGKEASSTTTIRNSGAIQTPFVIDLPEGFYIDRVFYYSSWVSNSNLVCVGFDTLVNNTRHFVVSNNYPFVRYTIKKVAGGDLTPSEFNSALKLITPGIDAKLDTINNNFNQLANEGFLFNIEKTIPVTQGTSILSRSNLFTGLSLQEGDTIKIRLTGTSVISEVWITNDQWHNIYKGAYTDGDIITVTLTEPTTSAGLYIEQNMAIGTGDVVVELATNYDDSLGGRINAIENKGEKKNIITVKRFGVSGVDADFCGLNAIGDAVASIDDASEKNQYFIMIDGHFLFTNPKMEADGGDFKYTEGGEPTPVISKEYVHFIGTDKERAVVEVRFDASLQASDFPTGKTFTDYQPIYIRTSSHIRNMTFIGTNIRYSVHIENNGTDKGVDIHFEDCSIVSKLSTKGYKSAMVVGEIPYFKLTMERCEFINENAITNALFGGHTPLSDINNGRENCLVVFDSCSFVTRGMLSLGVYAYNRKDNLVFRGCKFNEKTLLSFGANSGSKREIGTLVGVKSNTPALPYFSSPKEPCGLRVTATSGNPSSVRFDPTCTAFAIVGNANDGTQVTMPYSAVKEYGYEHKDDPNGSHAYACGWVNINPTTGNSLGSILGDCSGTSKTLKVTINGTDYNVVFNTDLTGETNENIIAAINAVIGAVATCDTFNPELLQFPDFDGEEYFLTNGDTATIERGMGVVKTDSGVIRRAKQADGYIDGISVDTIYPGQAGRIITRGKLFSVSDASGNYYFNINPVLSISNYGTKISIDPNNDGKFIVSNDAPVLRGLKDGIVEMI